MVLFISTKKSQVWSLDLMVAIFIFLGALLLFYKYTVNAGTLGEGEENNLLMDAKLISSYLVSTGYPEQWTESNVSLIGLTDGDMRIIDWKVEQFSNIALADYTNSRRLLSAMNNYYVSFEDKHGNALNVNGIWGIGKNYTADNPDSLIKVERFLIYNSSIIKLKVHVW
jgi:hypothetical protein